jgi:hypothetical protein
VPLVSFRLHPSPDFFSDLLIVRAEPVEIDDLLQMLTPGGLAVKIRFEVIRLDDQLFAHIAQ